MQKTGFLTAFWALAKPYWVSEQRTKGLVLLVTVIGLSVGLVWINVRITYWYNDFYNALQDKKVDDFLPLVGTFTLLALAYIAVGVYRFYLRQMLEIEWRSWLNERLLAEWLRDRAYYRLQLLDRGTDNPDQRIAEDLRLFVTDTLRLSLGLLSAIMTLVSFVVLLWTLSGSIDLFGVTIPGYMVWCVLLYTGLGTLLTHLIGRRLIGLEYEQQRFEADYRFSLVRLRENSEGVALYRGEKEELGNFRARFASVIANWWDIMRKRKQLNFFTFSYGQVAVMFPYVVAAPRYFAGAIPLGAVVQTASAFGQVQDSLSWIIDNYPDLAKWRATVDRLTGFMASLENVREQAERLDGERVEGTQESLALENLALDLPQGKPLLAATSIELLPGEDVLVTGPSGAGKSTFFRTLAGIWPYWQGRLRLPKGARLLFLPQKPYLPIGTLKKAVAYPADTAQYSDAAVGEALQTVGLSQLASDLERSENWALMLSGGEQQRLAFARALLNAPDWLFLDEATASLPEQDQEKLYRLLKERLPRTTLVSIGHRGSLRAHHERHFAWQGERLAAV